MLKILIAVQSTEVAEALQLFMDKSFDIRCCADGNTAITLLDTFLPDVLILDLYLPQCDGFTVLQKCRYRPPTILATTPHCDYYDQLKAQRLGVSLILLSPRASTVVARMTDLLMSCRPTLPQPEHQLHNLLHMFNIPSHLDGYKYLCLAISHYGKDPGQLLKKDIYDTISQEEGKSASSVEVSIRRAIQYGWEHRNAIAWLHCFPYHRRAPSNKEFIARLAEEFLPDIFAADKKL